MKGGLRFDLLKVEDHHTAVLENMDGYIDYRTIPILREQIVRLHHENITHVILDMHGIEYIDSTGLGILVKLADNIRQKQGTLITVRVPNKVETLLSIMGLTKLIPSHPSLEDALLALKISPSVLYSVDRSQVTDQMLEDKEQKGLQFEVVKLLAHRAVILKDMQGFIDHRTIPQLREQIARLQKEHIFSIVLDMHGVDYVDSTGIGILVKLADKVQQWAGCVVMCRVSSKVDTLLATMGLRKHLPSFPTLEEALLALKIPPNVLKDQASSKGPASTATTAEKHAVPPPPPPASAKAAAPAPRPAGPAPQIPPPPLPSSAFGSSTPARPAPAPGTAPATSPAAPSTPSASPASESPDPAPSTSNPPPAASAAPASSATPPPAATPAPTRPENSASRPTAPAVPPPPPSSHAPTTPAAGSAVPLQKQYTAAPNTPLHGTVQAAMGAASLREATAHRQIQEILSKFKKLKMGVDSLMANAVSLSQKITELESELSDLQKNI